MAKCAHCDGRFEVYFVEEYKKTLCIDCEELYDNFKDVPAIEININ